MVGHWLPSSRHVQLTLKGNGTLREPIVLREGWDGCACHLKPAANCDSNLAFSRPRQSMGWGVTLCRVISIALPKVANNLNSVPDPQSVCMTFCTGFSSRYCTRFHEVLHPTIQPGTTDGCGSCSCALNPKAIDVDWIRQKPFCDQARVTHLEPILCGKH